MSTPSEHDAPLAGPLGNFGWFGSIMVTDSHCPVCGHALSRHNSLGYCRNTNKTEGDCTCDMTTGSAPHNPDYREST